MNSTWYNLAVVLLWLATMSWLISQKVVPGMLVGEPPSSRTVVEAQRVDPLVGWEMAWNDRPVGWALSRTTALPTGLTEVRSKVRFEDLPLEEMTPGWLKSLLVAEDDLPIRIQMEANGHLWFDPLQRLAQFESSLGFPPADDVVKVRGTIDGTQLRLSVHSGELVYEDQLEVRKGLLTDALSPQTQLPGLREGQSWSEEVYSPLRPPNSPLEVVQATVEGTGPTLWDGRMVDAWLVVYRKDPGAGSRSARSPRGKLWVLADGTVIKQQVMLFDSTMTFVRLGREEAYALYESVGDWE